MNWRKLRKVTDNLLKPNECDVTSVTNVCRLKFDYFAMLENSVGHQIGQF